MRVAWSEEDAYHIPGVTSRDRCRVGSFQGELTRRVAEATAELRTVNQRLYAARQQVARSERLAAAMAHDVGTPLTGVSGPLQLLEEEVADPPVKERLRTIQGQVDRAAEWLGITRRTLYRMAARHGIDLSPRHH